MKFAVIEYSSKSGRVWRHTNQKPNYLCDPETIIDPTSFGCYVSALSGEHIPLLSLIIGTKSTCPKNKHHNPDDDFPINPLTKTYRRVFKKVTGSWPAGYSIDYLKKFDALLVVHQISDGHEITSFTTRVKKRFPHIFLVGVPTQPFGILKDNWPSCPSSFQNLKNFITACDTFITIVSSTKKEWQKITNRPVTYLPQPYPVEFTQRFFSPLKNKKKIIFVAGVTERNNITKGHIIANKLQQIFPDYKIHLTKTPGTSLNVANLKDTNYEIVPFLSWHKHLQYLAQTSLVINTDYTQTRGRVQCDCAAVGTPSIGADSDGQQFLFPQLPASSKTSLKTLITQGCHLLSSQFYYKNIVNQAKNNLTQYNYSLSAKRFTNLYKKYLRESRQQPES